MASYRVELDELAHKAVRTLPGNMRQRVLRALRDLESEPRPGKSRELNIVKAGGTTSGLMEVRRIRLDDWRVVYVIEPENRLITVLTVRQRPPYDYGDLKDLLARVV